MSLPMVVSTRAYLGIDVTKEAARHEGEDDAARIEREHIAVEPRIQVLRDQFVKGGSSRYLRILRSGQACEAIRMRADLQKAGVEALVANGLCDLVGPAPE